MGQRRPLRLIAATRNPAKLRAFQRVAGSVATVEPLPSDISLGARIEEQIEAAEDLARIAEQKAIAWSRAVGEDRFVIASDGGLLVPALGARWNPARSRRFAGVNATDLDRASSLLTLASGLQGDRRAIGWREAIGVARDGRLLFGATAEGAAGLLATDVSSEAIAAAGGFWVEALWRCPEFGGRLLAELTPDERWRRDDHWQRLGIALRPVLVALANESAPGEAVVE